MRKSDNKLMMMAPSRYHPSMRTARQLLMVIFGLLVIGLLLFLFFESNYCLD